jgi:hypothetical protein
MITVLKILRKSNNWSGGKSWVLYQFFHENHRLIKETIRTNGFCDSDIFQRTRPSSTLILKSITQAETSQFFENSNTRRTLVMTLALIKMAGSNLKTSLYWIQNFSSRYVQFYYGTCPIHHMHTHIYSSTPDVTHTHYVKFNLKILCPKSYTKFMSSLFPIVQSPKQKKGRKMQL